jgi:hypothetical protein
VSPGSTQRNGITRRNRGRTAMEEMGTFERFGASKTSSAISTI